MPGRVGFEALLPLNRPLDFFGRNLSLLDDPMRYDCSYSPVKEVQDPGDTLSTRAQVSLALPVGASRRVPPWRV